MADTINPATALYPDLPSASPTSPTPAANNSTPADRSTADAIYPETAKDGLAIAREGIEAGVAKPASEAEAEAAPAETGAYGLPAGKLTDQFSTLVKETGLNPANAARMAKLHQEALVETSTQYWSKTGSDWEKQSRTQFGGQLGSMVSSVKPLLADRSLTTPGFMRLLSDYRLGNNPDVVRTLANWARAMGRRG